MKSSRRSDIIRDKRLGEDHILSYVLDNYCKKIQPNKSLLSKHCYLRVVPKYDNKNCRGTCVNRSRTITSFRISQNALPDTQFYCTYTICSTCSPSESFTSDDGTVIRLHTHNKCLISVVEQGFFPLIRPRIREDWLRLLIKIFWWELRSFRARVEADGLHQIQRTHSCQIWCT